MATDRGDMFVTEETCSPLPPPAPPAPLSRGEYRLNFIGKNHLATSLACPHCEST
jgi:hypothetical protein